jgi:triphosphoribosyl-dephospho-CoA synthase
MSDVFARPPAPRVTYARARRDAARDNRRFCAEAARLAIGCLHTELTLYPKPGLVSPVDNGSHADMNASHFMRSLFALRHYFKRICQAGIDDAPFAALKQLGIAAETSMLRASGGVNTHRGAIFSLGLLCAAIGRTRAERVTFSPAGLRAVLLVRWGQELGVHTQGDGADSHGLRAAATHAVSGAREEAALGLPSVFEVGLPALLATLKAGRSMRLARIDALFALMAHISDTNVVHRGGAAGADTVRKEAQHFIDAGGTASADWESRAIACHHRLVALRLSPGGAADLLAATCLVHAVTTRGGAWPAA